METVQVLQREVYTLRPAEKNWSNSHEEPSPPLNYPNTISIQEGDSYINAVCSRYAKRSLPHKKTSRMTLSFNSAFIPFKTCSGKIWKLLTFRGRYSHLVVKLVEIAWILQLAFLPSCFPFQLIPQTQYKFFMLFNALSCVTLVLKIKWLNTSSTVQ